MKKTMNYLLMAISLVLMVSCSGKQDPLQLFLESDLAASQNNSAEFKISFDVKSEQQGNNKFSSVIYVKKVKNAEIDLLAFRIEEEGNTIITFDGESFVATDMKNNTQTISLKPMFAAEVASRLVQNFYMIIDTKLDTAEIRENSKNLEYVGTANVNGDDCYQVKQTGEGHGEFKVENHYYFSKKDKLMKKYSSEIRNKDNNIVQSVTYEIKDLKLNQPIDDKLFVQTIDSVKFTLTNLDNQHDMGGGNPHEGMNMESEDTGLLKKGTVAPDWSLLDASGKKVTLSQLKGKVVLLDFWATWCTPCKMVMPSIQKLHEKYANQGLVVIGINAFERDGDPVKYMKEQKFNYMLLLKGDAVAEAYKVQSIPTMYLVDKQGKIAHTELGAVDNLEAKLEDTIKKLIATK